jgi:predicted transcriptional regulator YheO
LAVMQQIVVDTTINLRYNMAMQKTTLETLKRFADAIVGLFGDRCEIVIHDFSNLARSVVYIAGNVTNRSIGAPVTDLPLRLLKEFGNNVPDKVGYKNTTGNGKFLKCSTIFLRDQKGKVEGCINFNVTDFVFLSTAFADFSSLVQSPDGEIPFAQLEHYTKSFAETMESTIDTTVAEYGKLPAAMDKNEKFDLMRKLDRAGVFMIKGSVEYLAKVFGLSRYTIYSYLKEIRKTGYA